MIKHILAMVALSLLMVLGLTYYHQALQMLLGFHDSLSRLLGHIFAGSSIGRLLQHGLALLLVPLVIGAVAGLIYWVIRKSQSPHVVHFTWIVWIILATTLACR
jgi:hypothetical protein